MVSRNEGCARLWESGKGQVDRRGFWVTTRSRLFTAQNPLCRLKMKTNVAGTMLLLLCPRAHEDDIPPRSACLNTSEAGWDVNADSPRSPAQHVLPKYLNTRSGWFLISCQMRKRP